jgi:hypothetical protein
MAPITRHRETDPAAALDLLRQWVRRRVSAEAAHWLDIEVERQCKDIDERRLGVALGLVGRRIGRTDLALSNADRDAAEALRPEWRPDLWGTDEAARVALVLSTWRREAEAFAPRVDRLCANAELNEHVAFVKGLAVFPAPEQLLPRAREAARSSVQVIFDAIACHNPYAAHHFDEPAYNQLVVKSVFCDIPIATIVGLRERRNEKLIRMLRDLVSERHAAGRTLPEAVHSWIADAA